MQSLYHYNNVQHVTTDQAGNIYLMGPVGSLSLKLDGQPLQAWSDNNTGNTPDILLASFTKQGQYRWAKVIGGTLTDVGLGLHADSLGFVYISGMVFNIGANPSTTAVHFDLDTILPQPTRNDTLHKIMFVARYDTAGNFQWLRMPEPDTVSLSHNGLLYRQEVDENGNIYWLCHLRPGEFAWQGNNIISQRGEYLLEFDPQGNVINHTLLDLQLYVVSYGLEHSQFVRNHQTGNIFVAGINEGVNPLLIGPDTIKGLMYLAAFDSTGQVLWKKESTGLNIGTIEAMEIDDGGNLYITGLVRSGTQFNGHTFFHQNLTTVPYIMKIDSSGGLVWVQTGSANAVSQGSALAINDLEVAVTGYAGNLYWQGSPDTMKSVINQGYDAFLARFDKATGDLLGMERTSTNFGGAAYGHALAAGPANTYYLGGNFDQQLYLGPDSLYKLGSQRSLFLAKYTCDAPQANFIYLGQNSTNTVHYAYSGSPADSVRWRFGDGTFAWGDTVQHSYTAKGYYRVCATAYFDCTEKNFCDSIAAGTIGLEEVPVENGLFTLAPNPATNQVSVSYLIQDWVDKDVVFIEVYDLKGARLSVEPILSKEGSLLMNTDKWLPSVYIVALRKNGVLKDYQRLVVKP